MRHFICSFTGTFTKCLNMGSYNYLGFAECNGPCASASQKAVETMGVGACSPRHELGIHIIYSYHILNLISGYWLYRFY